MAAHPQSGQPTPRASRARPRRLRLGGIRRPRHPRRSRGLLPQRRRTPRARLDLWRLGFSRGKRHRHRKRPRPHRSGNPLHAHPEAVRRDRCRTRRRRRRAHFDTGVLTTLLLPVWQIDERGNARDLSGFSGTQRASAGWHEPTWLDLGTDRMRQEMRPAPDQQPGNTFPRRRRPPHPGHAFCRRGRHRLHRRGPHPARRPLRPPARAVSGCRDSLPRSKHPDLRRHAPAPRTTGISRQRH